MGDGAVGWVGRSEGAAEEGRRGAGAYMGGGTPCGEATPLCFVVCGPSWPHPCSHAVSLRYCLPTTTNTACCHLHTRRHTRCHARRRLAQRCTPPPPCSHPCTQTPRYVYVCTCACARACAPLQYATRVQKTAPRTPCMGGYPPRPPTPPHAPSSKIKGKAKPSARSVGWFWIFVSLGLE